MSGLRVVEHRSVISLWGLLLRLVINCGFSQCWSCHLLDTARDARALFADSRPSHTCYLAVRDHSALKGTGINKRTSKTAIDGALPPWDGVWLTPVNKPPSHTCYHVKFSHSLSKCVCIDKRKPQKLGSNGAMPLAFGRGWLLEKRPTPTCHPAEFGHSRSDHTSIIKEIHLKILTSCVLLFKVVVVVSSHVCLHEMPTLMRRP